MVLTLFNRFFNLRLDSIVSPLYLELSYNTVVIQYRRSDEDRFYIRNLDLQVDVFFDPSKDPEPPTRCVDVTWYKRYFGFLTIFSYDHGFNRKLSGICHITIFHREGSYFVKPSCTPDNPCLVDQTLPLIDMYVELTQLRSISVEANGEVNDTLWHLIDEDIPPYAPIYKRGLNSFISDCQRCIERTSLEDPPLDVGCRGGRCTCFELPPYLVGYVEPIPGCDDVQTITIPPYSDDGNHFVITHVLNYMGYSVQRYTSVYYNPDTDGYEYIPVDRRHEWNVYVFVAEYLSDSFIMDANFVADIMSETVIDPVITSTRGEYGSSRVSSFRTATMNSLGTYIDYLTYPEYSERVNRLGLFLDTQYNFDNASSVRMVGFVQHSIDDFDYGGPDGVRYSEYYNEVESILVINERNGNMEFVGTPIHISLGKFKPSLPNPPSSDSSSISYNINFSISRSLSLFNDGVYSSADVSIGFSGTLTLPEFLNEFIPECVRPTITRDFTLFTMNSRDMIVLNHDMLRYYLSATLDVNICRR